MEDLPLGRIAALVPEFAAKDLPLGKTLMMMMIYKSILLGPTGYTAWNMIVKLFLSPLEQRLRLFQNKVFRKIFKDKIDLNEITGKWRNLHNTELCVLYSNPNTIRNLKSRWLRWVGYVARMKQYGNSHRAFVERLEGKRLLGKPRHNWEDNITMNLREVGCCPSSCWR